VITLISGLFEKKWPMFSLPDMTSLAYGRVFSPHHLLMISFSKKALTVIVIKQSCYGCNQVSDALHKPGAGAVKIPTRG